MSAKHRTALEILAAVEGRDPRLDELVARERAKLQIARRILDLRTAAGLTQAELARRIGTQQPVIARLEDADYDGQSLKMLQRIAAALRVGLEVRFVPLRETPARLRARMRQRGVEVRSKETAHRAASAPSKEPSPRKRPAART